MNIALLLDRAARVFPHSPALIHGARLICTYHELARRAGAIATALRTDLGLQPGDRVALVMANCPEYLELLYGAWYAGLVVVPVNAKLHPREVEYILAQSGSRICFVTHDLAPALAPLAGQVEGLARVIVVPGKAYAGWYGYAAQLPVSAASDDVAWLFYTSGTTGHPKGVMLTHRNLLAMTLCYFTDVDQIAHDDSTIYAAPISHGAGMYNFAHMLRAARHVIPESGSFDPGEIFTLARMYPGAAIWAAPTMVKRLVEYARSHGADGQGLKTVIYGGGPMYVEDIRAALAVLGDRFVQIYGQGESPMTITALSRHHLMDTQHPRYLERLASVGVAQSAVEVRVAGDDGQPLPPGSVGEVLVRGDTVMRGYWQNPAATAAAIQDGWLRTGDIGCMDADGFLTLKDRSKDVIISGGMNIYPREVEEVLLRHPAVHEVAVVGQPDREWGEAVVAFVVVRAGMPCAAAELDQLCLDHIARYKRPRQYRMVERLPKNNYGKVLKTELRSWLQGQPEMP